MIPKFRAFNKKIQKMYSIDGFKSSERKQAEQFPQFKWVSLTKL